MLVELPDGIGNLKRLQVLNGFYALETISAGPFLSLTEMHISRII
jgi:hypothetical protein